MIKQKAHRDMTVTEFIDLVEKRYHTEEPTNMNAWLNTLRMIAEEPAPNPFTEDQLGALRELQNSGYDYAAKDRNGLVWLYEIAPQKDERYGRWMCDADGGGEYMKCPFGFIEAETDWDDPEPLCFADYAPLEVNHE